MLIVTSCTLLNTDQVQEYLSPQNVARGTFSALLKAKPDAADACSALSEDLQELAQEGVLDLETAYSRLAEAIQGSSLKYKKEVLVAIRALFNEYAYVFDTTKLDFKTYELTIKQFAAGIDQALLIYDANIAQIRNID